MARSRPSRDDPKLVTTLTVVDHDSERRRAFSSEFDDEFFVTSHSGKAFFGTDVLRGLIEGIDNFRQKRWRRYRSLGPALLGSAMWIDDEELIGRLGDLSAACIVVKKQGRSKDEGKRRREVKKLERLVAVNGRTPGMPLRAFSDLTGLAAKVRGGPVVVGPSSTVDDWIPTIRTLGFRGLDPGQKQVPIVHAKLALLGHLWWHDEDGTGAVTDVLGFDARRLWVSSANFTQSSRHSLEFGFWTEEAALLEGAERFLVKLLRSSEGLDPEADLGEPDLAEIEFDDAAMADSWAEMWPGVEDDEDDDYT